MRDAKPYAVPRPSRIAFEGWKLASGDPLGDFLEGWDPQSDVDLEQTLRLDVAGIAADAGLAAGKIFRLNVSCVSTDTGMTETLLRTRASEHQVVRVRLPGSRIGGTVQIRTTLTLESGNLDQRPGIATKAGSVLGEHLHALRLTGESPMFPVSVVDFASTSFGAYASWHLQLSDDLDAPFLGTYLLLLNERDTELLKAVGAAKPTAVQQSLLDSLEAGIAMVMVETALRAAQIADLDDLPPESVGDVLARYARIAEAYGIGQEILNDDASIRSSRLMSLVRAEGYGRVFS